MGFCRRWNENDRGFCECPGGCNESIWLMHSCPVSCNFRGKCVKGLCLCEDGFWGNDCGVTWGTTANGDIAPVLDLDYKVGGAGIVFPAAAPADSPVTVGSQGDPPMYPDDATFYIVDQPPQFRSQPNVWEHGDFWPLVYGDPRRTADPRNADYFFFTQSMVRPAERTVDEFLGGVHQSRLLHSLCLVSWEPQC